MQIVNSSPTGLGEVTLNIGVSGQSHQILQLSFIPYTNKPADSGVVTNGN